MKEKKSFTLVQLVKKISKESTKAISPSSVSLQQETLQTIERAIEQNEQSVEDLIHYLLIDIVKGNGLIRIAMTQLADYCFQKYSSFRKQICQKLTEFVAGAGLFGTSPPSNFSNDTQKIIFRTIANWDYEYGTTYPSLRAITRYLKESLHLPLPDISKEMIDEEMKERDLYVKQREYKIIRLKQVIVEMDQRCDTIKSDIKILEECLNLLFPSLTTRSIIPSVPTKPTYEEFRISSPIPEVFRGANEEEEKDQDTDPQHEEEEQKQDYSLTSQNQFDSLKNDYQHILSMIKRSNQTREIPPEEKKQEENDSDVSEWEDGTILETSDPPQDDEQYQLQKRRKITMFETIREANLGGINYSLEISLPTSFSELENENNQIIFEKIRELTKQFRTYTLPELKRWYLVLYQAQQLEESLEVMRQEKMRIEERFTISKYLKSDVNIENRMNDVKDLLDQVDEIIKNRCSLLLSDEQKL